MPKIFLFITLALFLLIYPNFTYASSNFVSRSGSALILNGQNFKFIGVNRYNLLTTGGTPYIGCGTALSPTDIQLMFSELKQLHVTAIRFWLFQSFTKSGNDLSRFDFVLSQAALNNIKVIPVLENQWLDCTQGGYKYNTWYQTGYLSPYGNYPLSLKDYINTIVPKYKDNPNILMWQIMNEAEAQANSTTYTPDIPSLYNFTSDVSNYIRSLDPNHLISLGTIGGGQPGTAGSAYQNLHALPNIDVLDYHDYGDEPTPIPPSLQNRITDAATLNKPLIVGEAGIVTQSTCSGASVIISGFNCFSNSERASFFQNKLNAFFNNPQDAGYLIWSYRDKQLSDSDLFAFGPQDPLSFIIEAKSTQLLSSPSPSTFRKTGDLDADGDVDLFDYNTLLFNFGKSGVGYAGGDIDGNGRVGIADYNILLFNFGKSS